MGYYTDYSLNVAKINVSDDSYRVTTQMFPDSDRERLDKEVELMNVFDDGDSEYGWTVSAKWYNYRMDMCLLSKKFPDILFELQGYGEEREDMWIEYFYNGEYQRCVASISYDDFKKFLR